MGHVIPNSTHVRPKWLAIIIRSVKSCKIERREEPVEVMRRSVGRTVNEPKGFSLEQGGTEEAEEEADWDHRILNIRELLRGHILHHDKT